MLKYSLVVLSIILYRLSGRVYTFEENTKFCIRTEPMLLADIEKPIKPIGDNANCEILATTLTVNEKVDKSTWVWLLRFTIRENWVVNYCQSNFIRIVLGNCFVYSVKWLNSLNKRKIINKNTTKHNSNETKREVAQQKGNPRLGMADLTTLRIACESYQRLSWSVHPSETILGAVGIERLLNEQWKLKSMRRND